MEWMDRTKKSERAAWSTILDVESQVKLGESPLKKVDTNGRG